MSTKRLTPASFAAFTRSRVPCSITLSEVLVGALANRDQVDDDLGPLDRAPEARRVSHVALHELGAPGREGRR